jgi:tetratricopeptide (TPR) repeat protein
MVRSVLDETGPATPMKAIAWNDLGFIQLHRGELLDANGSLRNSVLLWVTLGFEDRAPIAVPLVNLASVQLRLDRHAVAERHLQRALEIRTRELGTRHPGVANLHNSLGELYRTQGHYSEAVDSLQKAIAAWSEDPPDRARLAAAWNNLALVRRKQGRVRESAELLQRAVETWKVLGHSKYWMALGNLAATYADLGMTQEAESAYRASLAGMNQTKNRRASGVVMMSFSRFLMSHGRRGEAKHLRNKAQALLADHQRRNALHHTVDVETLLNK